MAHFGFQAVSFPTMKQADCCYLSEGSIKIDSGKPEDAREAFLCNLLRRSARLRKRRGERMLLVFMRATLIEFCSHQISYRI